MKKNTTSVSNCPYANQNKLSPLNLRIRHAVRELLLGQAQGVRRVLDAAHQDLAHRALHGDLLLLRRLREIRVLARARGGFLWVDKTRKGQSNCAYFYENKDERTAIVAYWSLASFAATHAASSSCANISSASISKFGRTCTYPQTTCASAAL